MWLEKNFLKNQQRHVAQLCRLELTLLVKRIGGFSSGTSFQKETCGIAEHTKPQATLRNPASVVIDMTKGRLCDGIFKKIKKITFFVFAENSLQTLQTAIIKKKDFRNFLLKHFCIKIIMNNTKYICDIEKTIEIIFGCLFWVLLE